MSLRKLILLGAVLATVALARGEDSNKVVEADEHDKNVIPQSTGHPRVNLGDFALPSGLATFLTNGGLVAGAVLAIGALAVLLAPLVGFKLCTFFGNCDATGYQGYSSPYGEYSGYQQGTYNNPVYQKRSLEYIGPILKTLGSAYEKYSRQVAASAASTKSA